MIIVVPVLLGLVLGLIVWIMCLLDLRKMRAGLMDPRGETMVVKALFFARLGAATSLFSLIVWGTGLCTFVMQWP
jgi:hypothetical protein